jgi:hypothetical protein
MNENMVANVQFYSDGPGAVPVGIGAGFLDGTGELVPVPAPTALGACGVLLGFLGFRNRRTAVQQRKTRGTS